MEGLVRSGFPLERVVSEAESAGGYATANKLNDFQLQRLKDNLIQLRKGYFPPEIPNITDMATGTGDLTPGGLEYLRRTGVRGAKQPYEEGTDTASGIMTRIQERMNKIKGMSDEMGAIGKGEPTKAGTFEFIDPTAEKASYASRFNPKNEVHVEKARALLEDPQIKGVYTEAEVKNAYDFEGLYQSHFDKGHVDVTQLFEQEGGRNIPQMRSAARDFLNKALKQDQFSPTSPATTLDSVISAEDVRYITEGGGGRAGDPINLMVKYFGKNVTENLPKNATKENIDKFTEFVYES